MHEALALVRRELGPDAAVLHTREVRDRWLGMLPGRRQIEVTASQGVNVPSRFKKSAAARRPAPVAAVPAAVPQLPPRAAEDAKISHQVHSQLSTLQAMMKDLCRRSKGDGQGDWPDELFHLFTELLDAEVVEEVARDLVERLRSDPRIQGLTDPVMLKARAAGIIEDDVRVIRFFVRVPKGMAIMVTLLFCVVTLLHVADFVSSRTYIVFNSDWRFGSGESSWFPERAADFIRREQLPGNIFEEYALGGYAAWSLGPQYPDFLDGRGDRLSPDLVAEQRKLYRENPDSKAWQAEADRWNLNVLLLATSGFRGLQKMAPLAFCQSATWRPVYMDDVSLVFVRNTPQNRPVIDRLEIDCRTHQTIPPTVASRPALYDYYLNSGALFFELQRDQEAVDRLRRASAIYPEDPNAHLLLAALFQRRQLYREAEQEFDASLALNPSSGALYSLGLLYADEGRNAEAIPAIERAAGESTQSLDMYMTLGKLQITTGHPIQALAAFAQAKKNSPFRNGGESLAPELYAEIAEGNAEANRLLGRWPEAIAFQQEATQRTPWVISRWNRLADFYESVGQSQSAAEARQRGVESQLK